MVLDSRMIFTQTCSATPAAKRNSVTIYGARLQPTALRVYEPNAPSTAPLRSRRVGDDACSVAQPKPACLELCSPRTPPKTFTVPLRAPPSNQCNY